MTLRRDRELRQMQKLVDRRTAALEIPQTARVLRRNTDGTTVVELLDGSCEARLGITGGRTGDVVLAVPTSARASRGTAGVARVGLSASLSSLWVERLDPNVYEPGDELTVTVIGRGFVPTTTFTFLLPDSVQPSPWITVFDRRFLDSEHFELDIRVDDAAPAVEIAGLAYE